MTKILLPASFQRHPRALSQPGTWIPGQESLPLPLHGRSADSPGQEVSPRGQSSLVISPSGTCWVTGTSQRSNTHHYSPSGEGHPAPHGYARGQVRLVIRDESAQGRRPSGRSTRLRMGFNRNPRGTGEQSPGRRSRSLCRVFQPLLPGTAAPATLRTPPLLQKNALARANRALGPAAPRRHVSLPVSPELSPVSTGPRAGKPAGPAPRGAR